MYRISLLLILLVLIPFSSFSQMITGIVSEPSGEALIGANVYWIGTSTGTSTNMDGEFDLDSEGISDRRVIASFVGFLSDTIDVGEKTYLEIILQESNTLKEAKVEGKRADSYISSLDPIKTEVITQGELRKAACCDLAGCFETQASVQPTTTNVITNSKELRILGLSGVYNQVLVDGMPLIQGLTYTYGISTIPGTLIESIHVSKGANSVVQGYESISGQINVQVKDPDKTDTLLVRAYGNSFAESRFDANFAHKWKKWSTIVSAHTSQPGGKYDADEDSFLDLPLLTRYSVYNKWKYGDKKEWGFNSKIALRYVDEERIGGQVDFDADKDKGTTNNYGQIVRFSQPEIFTETGYRRDDYFSVSLLASAFQHEQNSWFGTAQYNASQSNAYANFQGELYWKDNHLLKAGVSYRYVDIDENIQFNDTLHRTYGGSYLKHEEIPGAFVENAMHWKDDKFILITGIRVDNHNVYGSHITPRALFKYQIAENTTVRVSGGSGWRTINLFSENVNLLASSRDIVFTEELKPEEAINYGGNFTHKIYRENVNIVLALDFYRTEFQNQIFPDYDSEVGKAFIGNFEGESVSNGFQSEVNFNIKERVSLKLAYNYLDVYRIEDGQKEVLPFTPKHTFKSTISYEPLSKKWHFNMNVHWYGEQGLASTAANPEEYQIDDNSEPYTLVNAQIAKVWDKFEVFFGCENILGFRKDKPIISWQEPFSPYFDTSSVWGPTRGREFYLSMRFTL